MKGELEVIELTVNDTDIIEQLAPLAYAAFLEHSPGWLQSVDEAHKEIIASLEAGKISCVLVNANRQPFGWIGVIPHNSGRVWEIHPMMVAASEQGKGYGRLLIEHVENLARQRGVLTLELGTADLTNATSLSLVNIYDNPLEALANIKSLKRHPYEFYVKCGFKIVGVRPDADGRGKHGITLAKRVAPVD